MRRQDCAYFFRLLVRITLLTVWDKVKLENEIRPCRLTVQLDKYAINFQLSARIGKIFIASRQFKAHFLIMESIRFLKPTFQTVRLYVIL